jgi:hypothetical protein
MVIKCVNFIHEPLGCGISKSFIDLPCSFGGSICVRKE